MNNICLYSSVYLEYVFVFFWRKNMLKYDHGSCTLCHISLFEKGQQNEVQSNETMKMSRVIAFHFCCNALKCFLKETWIVNFNGLFWGLQTFEDLWCYLWTRYWQLRIVIDVRHIRLSKYEKCLFYISLKLKKMA